VLAVDGRPAVRKAAAVVLRRVGDPAIAKLLGLRARQPVLNIRRVAYTYADRPVESRVSWVDTREHEYLSDLWKSDPDHDR
jgi:DNA-binding GntR family transcriptional regulator